MPTFWSYTVDGDDPELLANNIADALEEMERLHPGWGNPGNNHVIVEINEDNTMQRFWYTDHTQTAWEAF